MHHAWFHLQPFIQVEKSLIGKHMQWNQGQLSVFMMLNYDKSHPSTYLIAINIAKYMYIFLKSGIIITQQYRQDLYCILTLDKVIENESSLCKSELIW